MCSGRKHSGKWNPVKKTFGKKNSGKRNSGNRVRESAREGSKSYFLFPVSTYFRFRKYDFRSDLCFS